MQNLELSYDNLTLFGHSFQGPLDLLLQLIRKQELDIFDLPVYQIAESFQKYVEEIQKIDLDQAGDYLEMAAELAYIKSRMLLPKVDPRDDPRQQLVDKVLEYEQLQQLTTLLEQRQQLGRDVFLRGDQPLPPRPKPQTDASASDLIELFHSLLARRIQREQPPPAHQIRRETVSVRQQLQLIYHRLQTGKRWRLSEMLRNIHDRPTLIASFLALLELCRLRQIRLKQHSPTDIEFELQPEAPSLQLESVEPLEPDSYHTASQNPSGTPPEDPGSVNAQALSDARTEAPHDTRSRASHDTEPQAPHGVEGESK
ncbi:MAG: segregation/condensation protein A [Myxococcota bacterium]